MNNETKEYPSAGQMMKDLGFGFHATGGHCMLSIPFGEEPGVEPYVIFTPIRSYWDEEEGAVLEDYATGYLREDTGELYILPEDSKKLLLARLQDAWDRRELATELPKPTGEESPQSDLCKTVKESWSCPHMRETSSSTDMGGESYRCSQEGCSYGYRLDYDEMR